MEKVLDMKLKTLISATVIVVFLLFAGIYYKTSPTPRESYHRIYPHPGKDGQNGINNSLLKDTIDIKQLESDKKQPDGVPSYQHQLQRSWEAKQILQHVPVESSIFRVNSMPEDQSLWPLVGNGHITTVVNSGQVFMNGLYNGEGAKSQRAAIPSLITVQITVEKPKSSQRTFSLDTGQGIFNETITGPFFSIIKLTYAHRSIPELFVVEVIIKIHDHPKREPLVLKLEKKATPHSSDIQFQKGVCDIAVVDCSYIHGRTVQSESKGTKPSEVHVVYSNIPDNITMADGMMEEMSQLYLMSVSPDSLTANLKFEDGLRMNQRQPLRRSHMRAWASLWSSGSVDMEGNIELAQLSYASLYYLLSSLPLNGESQSCALSSSGLGGSSSSPGHVTGDIERWVFPSILLLHANLSKCMLGYRVERITAAKEIATEQHYKGALFPWESTNTGEEVSADKSLVEKRHYVDGDIALAVQQYVWLTNDTTFLTKGQGADLVTAIAEFWESRIQYNTIEKVYTIQGAMTPGEEGSLVDNSLYTNSVAKASLLLPNQLLTKIGKGFSDKFKAFGDRLYIPFDNKLQYQPASDNYKKGTSLKDPEVILLNPHLTRDISSAVKTNNLNIYQKSVELSRSQMTLSSFIIQWLEVKKKLKAEKTLNKTLQFAKGPFKVWTEYVDGSGQFGFVPGMAAYLQTLLYGYAGIRVQQQQLTFNPVLPPGVSKFTIRQVDFLGQSLTFVFDKTSTKLTLTPSKTNPVNLAVIDMVSAKTHHFESENTISLPSGVEAIVKPNVPKFKSRFV